MKTIYMSYFNRRTLRCTSPAEDSGLPDFDAVVMMFGNTFVSRGERSVIYHLDTDVGIIFADHNLFHVDSTVNNSHTPAN